MEDKIKLPDQALEFLIRSGYTPEGTIIQTGRSFLATIQKDELTYLFKIGRSAEVSTLLENESTWYLKMNQLPNKLSLYIPKLIDSGTLETGEYWLIREYIPESGKISDGDTRFLRADFETDYLKRTVDFLLELPGISIELPNDTQLPKLTDLEFGFYKYQGKSEINNYVKKMAAYQAAKINYPSETLLSIIDEAEFTDTCLTYSDFKPWHFYAHGHELALIDAESVNNLEPLHSDLASYYTRMITILNREELATKILEQYVEGWSGNRAQFFAQFRALVARNAADELQDATRHNRVSAGNQRLMELVLSGSFLKDSAQR